jgi:hypothetical protein
VESRAGSGIISVDHRKRRDEVCISASRFRVFGVAHEIISNALRRMCEMDYKSEGGLRAITERETLRAKRDK